MSSVDTGVLALCGVAAYFRIASDPRHISRELALSGATTGLDDLLRAAKMLGLKARVVRSVEPARLRALPLPAIVQLHDGRYGVFIARHEADVCRVIDPVTKTHRDLSAEALSGEIRPAAILVTRRLGGKGMDPTTFGLRWFLPSIWRYRHAIGNVLLASLFVQAFALVTPLFFQVVVDKVLTYNAYSTLYMLAIGLLLVGLFDGILQFLRTYALSHSTNRMDVELGHRLFQHLLRLPMSYFENRAAGQTIARVRELETIRAFITGQALFSAIDLVFAIVFVVVLFAFSVKLTAIVLATVPVYVAIGVLVRPILRSKIKEKFSRGASSQQFLLETVVGMATIKSAAVEPLMQVQWDERLAAYVRTCFDATMLGAGGQTAIQYASKLTTVLVLVFGAGAVMDGELTVGALIAFNMIAGQAIQPMLRLSQLWQDFQQVQISVERLGDILNHPVEVVSGPKTLPQRPRGGIEMRHVTFRYKPGGTSVLKDISLVIRPGEVVGIVGPSGSGKSTLTKLMQRLYEPSEGEIRLDGCDLRHLDPAWLRSNIGVVLQDNLLFNRSVHDNIAFANPAMPRAWVMEMARLTGADEFISKMAQGYDTIIEERGANLSGGQRQRIAIARAIATNPPILIFDEATSALDYDSERLIRRNMARIVKGRTVLIIAHRLSAVRACDRIISIADGRIVEAGHHDELLDRPHGLYRHLWQLQNEGAAA